MIKKIKHFIKNEIWDTDLKSKSRRRIFVIRQIRIIMFAFKSFFEDRAALRATSLTYFTMLSIVPVFAMAFGIANGFGFSDRLNEVIENLFSKFEYEINTPDAAPGTDPNALDLAEYTADDMYMGPPVYELSETDKILNWIKKMVADLLDNTKGGLLAGIGFIILFWSVIQVLNNIELSFNDIWQVRKARSPVRKFSDYLAIMIISPFAIALFGSFTVKINQAAANIEFIAPMIKLVPWASIVLLFSIIYVVMPNTKVKPRYAVIAGILAGSLFIFFQILYFKLQIGVTKANTLYGSFAAIPLFLLWLQITWLIVLMGAEISFAYQNIENYEFENQALKLNHDNKRILSLVVLHHIIKNFEEGGIPKNNDQLSHELGIPLRLLNDLIFGMVQCGLVSELATDVEKVRSYQPAMDINKLTVEKLYSRLEKIGGDQLIVNESEKLDKIMKIHELMLNSMRESPSNILIKDI